MATLTKFNLGQRIAVNSTCDYREIVGKTGTVVRCLMRCDSAWIKMDEDIPESLASFPVGDDRRNHINLWPDDCEDL